MSKALQEVLKKKLGASILATYSQHGDETVVVAASDWVKVHQFLRDDPACQMNMLMDLCAVDFPDREPRFEIVCHLYSLTKKHRLRTKTMVGNADGDDAEVDTLIEVWRSADWFERETFDMFGVRFRGHPDLRRILLYPEFEGHPLRKDYAAGRAQPLVPYRQGPGVLDKQAPFGADEGMPFGRQTHDRGPIPSGDASLGARPSTTNTGIDDGAPRQRSGRSCARAARGAHAAQHGPGAPRDARHRSHGARALGRDDQQGGRADRLPAPRLREDVRARQLDAGVPVRGPPELRLADAEQQRVRDGRREDARHQGHRALRVLPRDPRRARAHLRSPDVQRRHGDGARRVHAVPLVHQGARSHLGRLRRGDRRPPHALVRPRGRHGQASDVAVQGARARRRRRRAQARRGGREPAAHEPHLPRSPRGGRQDAG